MINKLLIVIMVICLFSCNKADNESKVKFKRVLILGNSITYHKPSLSLDWSGNWGMAASVRDSDYVHIIQRNFLISKSNTVVKAINISEFENEYETYKLNKLDSLKDFNPDLLIIRIGENVNPNLIDVNDFSKHYIDLLKNFKGTNPQLKVICVSNYWKNPTVEEVIKQCAISQNAEYVSLSHLDEAKYTAWGLFTNPAVGAHPGNKGMQEIANLIWTKIEEINK